MQNDLFCFPYILYLRHLTVVHGIRFTPREIDVIACLLHGRGTSKIASLLDISPTTVMTHIQNIMEKLGCNSRENIIDFVERSQKLDLLKKYYARLLIHVTFEKALKGCSKLTNSPLGTLLVDSKHPQGKAVFSNVTFKNAFANSLSEALNCPLEAHLKLAGIEASVQFEPLTKDKSETHKSTLIVILEEGIDIPQRLRDFDVIDLRDQDDYYLSVITILKKLCSKVDFEGAFLEFRNVHKTMKEKNEVFVPPHPDLNLHPLKVNSLNVTFRQENIPSIPFLKNRMPGDQKERNFETHLFFKRGPHYLIAYLIVAIIIMGLFGTLFLIFYGPRQENQLPLFAFFGSHQPLELSSLHSEAIVLKDSSFLQRPELLAEIDQKFKEGSGIQTVALVGPGGAGKSVLARQYAYQQRANIIWEINAETNESLKFSYEALADSLTKKEEDKKTLRAIKEIEPSEERENKIIQFVQEKLKTLKWVLIYDNQENHTALKKYFPSNPNYGGSKAGSGKILITTRNDNIRHNAYVEAIVPIGTLSALQKYSLFCKIIKRGENSKLFAFQEKEIKAFLKEIPPFPLDVSVAAHYIKSTGTSYSQYIESELQSRETFVNLQENLLKEAGEYTKTRYSIITLSLQEMMRSSKEAGDLLLLIGLIDSQNIPRALLTKYTNNESVDTFVYHLKKYSLLLPQPLTLPSQPSTLSFHRSTHAALLAYLKKSCLYNDMDRISAIADRLERTTKDAIEHEDGVHMSAIKPHLKAFLSHGDLLNNTLKGAIEVELGCAYYYTHYQERAKQFLESSLSRLSLSPGKENNSRIAQALSYLGNMHKEIGDHKKARDLLEKSLLLYKRHDPQNSLGITRALASLGDTYKNLGDHHKARDLLEQSIVLSQKHPHSSQLEVARTMLYLGIVERDLGEYGRSIPLLQKSLGLFKKHENYIEIVRALKYLGNTYRSLGQYEAAKPLLEQSVSICKKYLPENHIALGRSLVHLATIYKSLGDYKRSQALLTQSLTIHQNVFGSTSVRTAWVMTQLATIDRKRGNFEKAKKAMNACLKTYLTSYGENSLRTAWVFMQLGILHEDLKNYEKAQELLETALKVHQSHFEEGHIKMAVILFHLGNVYTGLKHYTKATHFLEKSLKIYESHYGKEHIETAKILKSLGQLYLCKGNSSEKHTGNYTGDFNKAESLLKKALSVLKHKQHPYQYGVYESLADLHLQKAHIKKKEGRTAEALILKAQAIYELICALTLTQAHFPESSAHTKRIRATLKRSLIN